MKTTFLSALASLVLLWNVPAGAGTTHDKDIMIEKLQIRATTPKAGTTAAYGLIHNHGTHDDRLIGASARFAKKTELHEMKLDGDVMKMRAISGGIPLPAGGMIRLTNKANHIMLIGLDEPILLDKRYQITLEFEKAGQITLDAETIALSGKIHSATHDHNHAHKHKH